MQKRIGPVQCLSPACTTRGNCVIMLSVCRKYENMWITVIVVSVIRVHCCHSIHNTLELRYHVQCL